MLWIVVAYIVTCDVYMVTL